MNQLQTNNFCFVILYLFLKKKRKEYEDNTHILRIYLPFLQLQMPLSPINNKSKRGLEFEEKPSKLEKC